MAGPARPADDRPARTTPSRSRIRLNADTVGAGAILAAAGVCCTTTLAATGLGAGVAATVVALMAGLGWFVPVFAIILVVGATLFGARLRRHRSGRDWK